MNRILSPRSFGPILAASLVLAVILAFLFSGSFRPLQVVFSNDGPLGLTKSDAYKMPDLWTGFWYDLHWIGSNLGFAPASLTYVLLWLLGPVGFAKFSPPLALFFLGLGAWTFLRTIKLSPALCIVGAIAAALNSNYFSNTCWGLATRATTLGFIFFALAALSARRLGNVWVNAALGGLATGMAVVEGADNGIILSLFVGAFVSWQSFVNSEWKIGGVARSLRLALVVPCALFIAAQTFSNLFSLASQGSASSKPDQESKDRKWNFVSQWSLPPAETLRVIIPGLYGYRMDTPDGGNYWGRVGEAPGAPEQGRRFSGAGEYAGVLVVLLALWSLAASFRKGGVFDDKERNLVWFWAGAFVIAMLLSWGRFAPLPFYEYSIFKLPYFSSIRNPMKFMHAGHMALMILCGYGLLGLSRRYLEGATAVTGSVSARLKTWWAKANTFEKRWTFGMFAAVGLSLLIFLFYSSTETSLVNYLTNAQLPPTVEPKQVARFSIGEVGKFFLFLLASALAIFLIMGGVFARQRARSAAVLLGLILTVDLARANMPWILYWDYTHKYASNPILDTLREKPYEGRVVAPSFLVEPRGLPPEKRIDQYFPSLYGIEWVQHHFLYYNIQSIDVAQDPRPPADKQAYTSALFPRPGRYWELTNTRYVLGMAGFLDALNAQFDKGRNRFRIAARFDLAPKPGVANPSGLEDLTATTSSDGALALFEHTGALPRAKLFANWLSGASDEAVLKTLAEETFDPGATVLVSDAISAPAVDATNAAPGQVEFVRYSPQHIQLRAQASGPGVLLLNDRYDKDWRTTIDGQPAKLLRCNFIMRGVQVPAGQHVVAFDFQPSLIGLKISLAAIAIGVVLCGLLVVIRQPGSDPATANSMETRSAATAPQKK